MTGLMRPASISGQTLSRKERASWAYPIYARLLESLDLSGPIRSILADEKNHLADVLRGS